LLGVHFDGQPLNRLKSSADSVLARLGVTHVGLQAVKELVLRQFSVWLAPLTLRWCGLFLVVHGAAFILAEKIPLAV
jgi:hypothetical protein